jgi:hydrogenase maturation protease
VTGGWRVVVAALGNEFRQDDGAGPAVMALVGERVGSPGVELVGPLSDPLHLLGRWDQADMAIVVDAFGPGTSPGTLRVLELAAAGVASIPDATASTHGIELPRVLQLASILGQAPARVFVVGIEGSNFGPGVGLSRSVQAALPEAACRILDVISENRPCA